MTRSFTGAGLLALLLATTAVAQTDTDGSTGTGTASPQAETGTSAPAGSQTGSGDAATGSDAPSGGSGDAATGEVVGQGTAPDAATTETPGAETALGGPGGRTFGQTWSTSVGSAFFTDTGLSTVRPVSDIRSQWGTLSEEDRAAVREDCAAYRADAGTMNGAASGGVSDTSTDTDSTETETAFKVPNVDGGSDGFLGDDPAEGQAASAGPDSTPAGHEGGVTAAHMQQICAVIDTL